MKLFIGVHHNPPDGPGPIGIVLGTQALFHDYVMGPKYPATHAFVVVELEGMLWVIDGKPPRAQWTPCKRVDMDSGKEGIFPGVQHMGFPTKAERPSHQALWEIPHKALEGIYMARALDGAAYDWGEIAAAAATAFSILPGLHQFRMLGRMDLLHDSLICTHLCVRVLEAMGLQEVMKASMPDLFPERLAQVLRSSEGTWCRRVVP